MCKTFYLAYLDMVGMVAASGSICGESVEVN